MKREYPKRPIPGVGVVVFNGEKILLIKRNKEPKAAEWSIPGGAQDLGETLTECAMREVNEETGIKIENITLLKAVDYIDKDENNDIRFHYSLIDYMADYKSGDLVAGDDVLDAKWVHINDFKSYNLWQETIDLIEDAIVHRRSK
ncbi:NUDIX hydrolase [Pseudemcibacter aquimaris]|uniref:NUDIX hydrolase n=1 Tax=Pseudemcibacter aquimaris TaxID=2857064 RepID=UPI002011D98B|nr:NUDIX hydrolase [Pseudemcibacter aquimaris]MCC3861329.1 NUDIX hydrolase [Pseudemcibacter aquimaris]WDU58101.1 NUDIX hydrolase [Pseudemcibacter aquimaris]